MCTDCCYCCTCCCCCCGGCHCCCMAGDNNKTNYLLWSQLMAFVLFSVAESSCPFFTLQCQFSNFLSLFIRVIFFCFSFSIWIFFMEFQRTQSLVITVSSTLASKTLFLSLTHNISFNFRYPILENLSSFADVIIFILVDVSSVALSVQNASASKRTHAHVSGPSCEI